jgi:hypothetical protein
MAKFAQNAIAMKMPNFESALRATDRSTAVHPPGEFWATCTFPAVIDPLIPGAIVVDGFCSRPGVLAGKPRYFKLTELGEKRL